MKKIMMPDVPEFIMDDEILAVATIAKVSDELASALGIVASLAVAGDDVVAWVEAKDSDLRALVGLARKYHQAMMVQMIEQGIHYGRMFDNSKLTPEEFAEVYLNEDQKEFFEVMIEVCGEPVVTNTFDPDSGIPVVRFSPPDCDEDKDIVFQHAGNNNVH